MRKTSIKNVGWSVYLVEGADHSYFGDMARNMKKELKQINSGKKSEYFKRHPEAIPVKVVFEDKNLPFREAFAKRCYLRDMNRRQRINLVKRNKWNNSWLLYRNGMRSIPRIRGQY